MIALPIPVAQTSGLRKVASVRRRSPAQGRDMTAVDEEGIAAAALDEEGTVAAVELERRRTEKTLD